MALLTPNDRIALSCGDVRTAHKAILREEEAASHKDALTDAPRLKSNAFWALVKSAEDTPLYGEDR